MDYTNLYEHSVYTCIYVNISIHEISWIYIKHEHSAQHVKSTQQMFAIPLSSWMCFWSMVVDSFFLSQRWIWWSMQWASQSAWQERDLCSHQDPESWLYRQTEERLPEWGQHHGTVWPPEHNSLGRRCHQMYVGRSLYKAKLEVTGKLNTHFLSREMTDGADPLIANRRKSVQDKSLIL